MDAELVFDFVRELDESAEIGFIRDDTTVTGEVGADTDDTDSGKLDCLTHEGDEFLMPDAFAEVAEIGHNDDFVHCTQCLCCC